LLRDIGLRQPDCLNQAVDKTCWPNE
jgi:hypothetical protein